MPAVGVQKIVPAVGVQKIVPAVGVLFLYHNKQGCINYGLFIELVDELALVVIADPFATNSVCP